MQDTVKIRQLVPANKVQKYVSAAQKSPAAYDIYHFHTLPTTEKTLQINETHKNQLAINDQVFNIDSGSYQKFGKIYPK